MPAWPLSFAMPFATFWFRSMDRLVASLRGPVLQVYITGHGGDGFMKFLDKEEVTSDEIGAAFTAVSSVVVQFVSSVFLQDAAYADDNTVGSFVRFTAGAKSTSRQQ